MSDRWTWLYINTAILIFLWIGVAWFFLANVPGGPVVGILFYGVPLMILLWAERVLIKTAPRDFVHIPFFPIFAFLVLIASLLVCTIIDLQVYGLEGIQ